ncbi:SAM-dependent methyltransferase [[Pseudomonas] boreopolis]
MSTTLNIPASETSRGSIVCVGLGMTLGSHLTPIARSHIEQADVVFAGVSNGIVEQWLQRMHKDVRSLQPYYGEGKPRSETYKEWVDLMMAEVRAGKKVCGAFYGHPGVFAWSPHKVIEVARSEGYDAFMEPGISAEDCLYADLGIDPGSHGCQHFEVNQLVFFKRRLDRTAYLVLWQVAMIANESISRVDASAAYRQLLVDRLSLDYPIDHEVIVYRAAILPIEGPRVRKVALRDIAKIPMTAEETVVVPPAEAIQRDEEFMCRAAVLHEIYGRPIAV